MHKKKAKNLRHVLLMSAILPFSTASTEVLAQESLTKVWDKTIGGSGHDAIRTLKMTAAGGYLLGGISDSGAGGDKSENSRGSLDYWLVKVDATGHKLWDRTYGGSGLEVLTSVVEAADGGYLVGGQSLTQLASGDKSGNSRGAGDFWLVKVREDGSKVWDITLGGNNWEDLLAMTTTADGGYLLGGFTESDATGDVTETSFGLSDFWVVKLHADGSKAWDKRYGGSSEEMLKAIVKTNDGGYLLAGYSSSGADGNKTTANRGDRDYWVVKIDENGTRVWDKTFGGTGSDDLQAAIATADGGFLLGGYSYSGAGGDKTEAARGDADYWVVKIDRNGNKVWDKTLGGDKADILTSMVQTTEGTYLLGGYSSSGATQDKAEASQGEDSMWLVMLNQNGSKAWDRTLGGNGSDYLWAMTMAADGSYLLGGTSSSAAGGDKTENSRGASDFWLVNLRAAPLSAPVQENSQSLMVYPNPSYGNVQVLFPGPTSASRPLELILYNALGQQVLRHPVEKNELHTGIIVQTSALPPGVYFLKLQLQGAILTKQIVIK